MSHKNGQTERKAFNFYKSYADVFFELPPDQRLAFIEAVLTKQFTGKDPEGLEGLAKFAYMSQKHSIEAQVKGWMDKTGNHFTTPAEPPPQAPTEPPPQQEKEKEKEEGKGKEDIPLFQEVREFAVAKAKEKSIALDLTQLSCKYDSWKESGWRDGFDKPIKNWKSKILNTIPHLTKKANPYDQQPPSKMNML